MNDEEARAFLDKKLGRTRRPTVASDEEISINPITYRPGPLTRRDQAALVAQQQLERQTNLAHLEHVLEAAERARQDRAGDDPFERLSDSEFLRGVLGPRSAPRPFIPYTSPQDDAYASAVARGMRLGGPVSSRAPESYARAGLRPDLEQAVQEELNVRPRTLPPPIATVTWPQASPPSSVEPTTRRAQTSPVPSRVPTVRSARAAEEDTADTVRDAAPAGDLEPPYVSKQLECSRQMILNALKEADGNKSEAARRLGIGHSGFYKALRRVGLPTSG